MNFKKLVLVSAMFAATSGAFAMEAMDEESLAATTGQDGISIGLATQANLDIIIHDKDGFAGAVDDGAIVLSNVGIAATGGGDALIDIDIDAGSNAGLTAAALNVGITVGNAIDLDLGELSVAVSNGYGNALGAQTATLIDLGTAQVAAGATVGIQLGNLLTAAHFIEVNANLTGGLTLTGLSINDVANGGAISMGSLIAQDANGSGNLLVDLGIDATTTGLEVTVNTLGNTGLDVTMTNLVLGGGSAIGDVEIRGLNMTGDVITISGH